MAEALWHMESEVLDGFYSSDIFICAGNKLHAVVRGTNAYDTWVTKYIKDCGIHPLTSLMEDDEEFEDRSAEMRRRFVQELHDKLQRVTFNAMILRSV